MDDDRCRRHNDFLIGTWSEETWDGVINVRCALNNSDRREERSQPAAQIRASKSLQPRREVNKAFAKCIGHFTTYFDFLDAGQLAQCFGLRISKQGILPTSPL
jgi:hypothetical protein